MTHEGVQPQAQEIKDGIFTPTSRQFAEMYDGRPVLVALDEFNEQTARLDIPSFYFPELGGLPDIPGWVINGKFFNGARRVEGRIIPLMPAEGEIGKKARQELSQEASKYGFVFAAIVRMPGGRREQEAHKDKAHQWQTWGRWDHGFIDYYDLLQSPEELLIELRRLEAETFDPEIRKQFSNGFEWQKALKEKTRRASMVKLALFAQTPEDRLVEAPAWDEIFLPRATPDSAAPASI